jgi:hypothetical protein
MLDFKKRVLKFSFDGNEYKIDYPNVRQTSKFSKDYEVAKDKIEVVINFLDKLGFDKEVCEQMEMDHLNQILEKLTEAKK